MKGNQRMNPSTLRYKSVWLGLLLLSLQPSAMAFGTMNDQQPNPLSEAFKALDKDHDGSLTREEAAHDEDIANRFNNADFNQDGKLNESEYTNTKSAQQQARMQMFLEDSSITAKVKAELLKEDGIRGLVISVETHRGKVILSGFVDNEDQARRATEIASGIRGVTGVRTSLVLKG
jgi:hyperosmotically inducible protein